MKRIYDESAKGIITLDDVGNALSINHLKEFSEIEDHSQHDWPLRDLLGMAWSRATTSVVMRTHSFVLSIVVASCFLASANVQAEACGSLQLDDEPQEVILGESGRVNDFYPENYILPFRDVFVSNNRLGVCWRDKGGAWNFEQISGCDTSTAESDTFLLSTGGGDDYVAPLLEEQTYHWPPGLNWILAKRHLRGIRTHAMRCPGGDQAIAPWNPRFSFGVTAVMGTGADEFHGTPNNDSAQSNYVSQHQPRPTPNIPHPGRMFFAPADNALDMLCGGAGNDRLLGDADDDWRAGYEEHLDGGLGEDFCDGDPLDGTLGVTPRSSRSDVAKQGCNTIENAAVDLDHLFSCDDNDRDNPIVALELCDNPPCSVPVL